MIVLSEVKDSAPNKNTKQISFGGQDVRLSSKAKRAMERDTHFQDFGTNAYGQADQ